jgi:DNA-binding HxlR family transcriptional regulator
MNQPMSAFCPRYHHAVELLGRRWAGAIIRVLLPRRARYNEIRASIPDISDRMLSERLRELEGEGLVARTVVPETPIRVEYELTEKGRSLEPIVLAIGDWAQRWIPGVPACEEPSDSEKKEEPALAGPQPARTAGR